MKSKLSIIFVVVTLFGCDPVDNKLVIKNESDNKIYYMSCPNKDLASMYRHEVKLQGTGFTYLNFVSEVMPNRTKHESSVGIPWEGYIDKVCENGKLRIFTFSIDTLKKYDWKDINEHGRYLMKKEFSIEDLKKLKWEVSLP